MITDTRSARPDHRLPARIRSRHRRIDPVSSLDLGQIGRTLVAEIPLLAMINLLVGLATAVVAVAFLTVPLLAPVVAAGVLGPVWLGATATCARLLAGDPRGPWHLFGAIWRHGRTGIGLALLPAAVATLLLGSLGILAARPEQRWLLVPIAVDVAALTVIGLGGIAVFPLAVMTESRGRQRWLIALALAGRGPVTTAGITAIVVLLILAARHVTPFLALVMMAPLCLLMTAVSRHQLTATAHREETTSRAAEWRQP